MRILLTSLGAMPANDVEALLTSHAIAVEHIPSAEHAQLYARTYSFDIIVLHLASASTAAIDLIGRLRAIEGRSTPVMVVARQMAASDQALLLDAGADDVVMLPSDGKILCARLRAAVRRTVGFTRSVLQVGPVELDMAGRSVTVAGQPVHMSATEFRLLELLLLRKNSVVRKETMLHALYDNDEPEIKSVDVMIHRLRKRLAGAGLDSFIATVWAAGYIVRQADEPAVTPTATLPPHPRGATPAPRRIAGAVTQ